MAQLLEGVRVLDLTRVLSGPYCTRLLCDLGAEVIKLEPPDADMSRGIGERRNGLSAYFVQQNVGKLGVCIDFRHPDAIALILELVAQVDVLVDNFRPGVMARFGLDEPTLHARNPRLVHCQISGFGQAAPSDEKRAFAGVIHAMTGHVDSQARADGREPSDYAHPAADTTAGLHACNAILAALFARERTGRGQTIDIAMHDCMLSVNETIGNHLLGAPDALHTHWRGQMIHTDQGSLVFSGDPVWNFAEFCSVIGRPELRQAPGFVHYEERKPRRAEILELLRQWVRAQPDLGAAERTLDAAGFPTGRVRSIPEALESVETRSRGMVCEIDDRGGGTLRVLNTPYRFSDAESGPRGVAAYRGEHNRHVLGEIFGLSPQRIEALEASGALIATKKKPG
jgi:CoA:oxalate CoA-transferase